MCICLYMLLFSKHVIYVSYENVCVFNFSKAMLSHKSVPNLGVDIPRRPELLRSLSLKEPSNALLMIASIGNSAELQSSNL